MKVYGIAQLVSQVYGHGDCGSEQHICRMGPYGSGEFPPLFHTAEAAQVWISQQQVSFPEFKVVELELK
jgi:hypothetical protein